MIRIKVFITGVGADQSTGNELTKMCDEWLNENPTFEIQSIKSSSNKYAWGMFIKYEDNIKEQ